MKKIKRQEVVIYNEEANPESEPVPTSWEIPFTGDNRYTGNTFVLLAQTIQLESHQCFIPSDFDRPTA